MLNNVQVWLSTPTALLPQPPCNPLYTGIVYTALNWSNQQNAHSAQLHKVWHYYVRVPSR